MTEIIEVNSLEETEGMEGCYVKLPQYRVPVYIPKRNKDGVPILPADWYEKEEWDDE